MFVNPFHYPKTKCTRKLNPPPYSNYRRYKPFLRDEFGCQCVYCRTPDRQKGVENFGVDHYRPKKHFPELETEYLNLYYSCNRCNSLKRDFWPSTIQAESGEFIPNPCEHVMFEHLRYRDGTVDSASPAGKWTIDLLDLNAPDSVDYRSAFVAMHEYLRLELVKVESTINELKARIAKTSDPAEVKKLEDSLAVSNNNREKLEDICHKLVG